MASRTRDRILDAADRLFYDVGIHVTGVDALAAEANVSKRTLYNHFPAKTDVVLAYLESQYAAYAAKIAEVRRSDRTPTEQLLACWELFAPERGCPFILATAEFADPEDPVRLYTQRAKSDLVRTLEGFARRAGIHDPRALGWQLAALIDGANLLRVSTGDDTSLRQARAAAVALISAGQRS